MRKNDIVKVLIDNGANIDNPDGFGQTALIMAAWHGDTAITKQLLQHKAAIHHKDHYGRSAIMWAEIEKNTKVLRLLRAADT